MDTPPLAVALVAPDGDEQRLSARELTRSMSVELDQFASLEEFRRGCAGKRYSGVAVALGTLARMEEPDKLFLIDLAQSFPLLRIHQTAGREGVAGTVAGEALEGAALLERFGQLCRRARPRGVRLEIRQACALCSTAAYLEGPAPERACIINVSRNGFFVATPHERVGPALEVVVEALSDKTPIACEVRWHQPWGADARTIPGFGVFIKAIAEGQRTALAALVEPAPAE
jgi:hypothetical protein